MGFPGRIGTEHESSLDEREIRTEGSECIICKYVQASVVR